MLAEQIAVMMTVTDTLEGLDVSYAIGGSFASALHGVMRATMDADLVADLRLEHAGPLAQTLGGAFYAEPEMMRNAIQQAQFLQSDPPGYHVQGGSRRTLTRF